MNKPASLLQGFALLVIIINLPACGPSAQELATQTAAAWSATPSATAPPTTTPSSTPTALPTDTPIPTDTPTPTPTTSHTPTITPTITPTATTGRIQGKVYRSDTNLAFAGVFVRYYSEKSRQVYTETLTDEQGQYVIENLEPGGYNLYFIYYLPDEKSAPCSKVGVREIEVILTDGIVRIMVVEKVGQPAAVVTHPDQHQKSWQDYYLVYSLSLTNEYSINAGEVLQLDIDFACP